MANNISGLKPLYQCDEHDKINMFAATGVMQKGTLVAIGTAIGNTNVFQNTGTPPATPYQTVNPFGNAPAYAYSAYFAVAGTVKSAGPTDACIGMTLNEVRELNSFGENYRYRPSWDRHEQQIVLLGESVPIARRGIFSVDNIVGTATAGSGFTASGGRFVPQAYSVGTSLGVFLTNEDANGYATIALNCV